MKINRVVAIFMAMVTLLSGLHLSRVSASIGDNVAVNNWQSFSVCTREDGGVWEDAFKKVEVKDVNGNFLRYQTKGQDYATEGYITAGVTNSNFDFYVKNTGWDGKYDSSNTYLIGDNPWGLTATMEDIPINKGTVYTMSFDIKSTLKGSINLRDDNGGIVYDENGRAIIKKVNTKHILLNVYKPGESQKKEFNFNVRSYSEITKEGVITLDSSTDKYKTVEISFEIPENYDRGTVDVQMALGSFLLAYPEEIAMSGYIYVKNFKIIEGEKISTSSVKGSEQIGQNIARVKIKNITRKKTKAKIQISKVKSAKGYEYQFCPKKDFDSGVVRKKISTKTKCSITKLKKNTKYFVRVRAFKTVEGKKVYGVWSKIKKIPKK